jgi:hypothetical protein
VALRDRNTLDWWTGSGWGGFTWLAATMASPGSVSTPWTYGWTPPAAGDYAIVVRARDTSNNIDPTKPWVPFVE